MSNEEFLKCASTIRQFEEIMGISEFSIDTNDTIGNLDKVTLSFENDVLSFENDKVSDDTIKEPVEEKSVVEEAYTQPKLTLSKDEYNRVIHWLDEIRRSVNRKSLKKYCAQTKDYVIKGSITYNELYNMLEEIKKQYDFLMP